MTAHLLLPYKWISCDDRENCPEYVHLDENAEELNTLPIKWVESLLGHCSIVEKKEIIFCNEKGQLHHVTGPAYRDHTGEEQWVVNGVIHRVGGPARTTRVADGRGVKVWYINGKRHRVDGPAEEYEDGHRNWYQHGQPHRVDGPAIETPAGLQAWFLNGENHRTDGPAVIYSDGKQEWWVHGVQQPNSDHMI